MPVTPAAVALQACFTESTLLKSKPIATPQLAPVESEAHITPLMQRCIGSQVIEAVEHGSAYA